MDYYPPDFQYESSLNRYFQAVNDVASTDIIYFFTLSPKQLGNKQHLNYAEHIWDYFFDVHQVLDKFCIIPELNGNGNIHYHGWFSIKDKYRYYRFWLPRMKSLGFVKINECKTNFLSDSIPYAYHLKDFDEMVSQMSPFPIPLTHSTYKNIKNTVKYVKYPPKSKYTLKYWKK